MTRILKRKMLVVLKRNKWKQRNAAEGHLTNDLYIEFWLSGNFHGVKLVQNQYVSNFEVYGLVLIFRQSIMNLVKNIILGTILVDFRMTWCHSNFPQLC